jgi:enoyl-CoA hydratase
MSDSVTYELDGQVAVITFDDGKANVYDHEVLDAIAAGFDRAEQEATAVLLVGRPGRFSAGFNLSIMTSGVEPMRALVSHGAELMMKIFVHPQPVVAACSGHALAAGALILMSCDRRIGVEGSFKIGLNEVAIGMGLPHFAVELARYRMPASAFDTVVLGNTFAPGAAVAAGLLDTVVDGDHDALLAAAKEEAHALSALSNGAVAHTKRLARQQLHDDILERLAPDMASITGPS